MRRASRVLGVLLPILAVTQLVVGFGFWSGHWFGLRTFHIAVGTAFVLVLWTVAGLALRERRGAKLAVFALVWGIVLAAFGMAQQRLLIGDWHWVISVVHLATAIVAMMIAGRLNQEKAQPSTEAVRQLGAA